MEKREEAVLKQQQNSFIGSDGELKYIVPPASFTGELEEQKFLTEIWTSVINALIAVIANENISKDSKRNILMILFNFTDEQATEKSQ